MAEDVATRARRTLAVWEAGADVRYERWQATVQELLDALTTAETERDAWSSAWDGLWADYEAAELRATRLAAVARQWATHRAIARDPTTDSAAYWANTKALVQAEARLAERVAALDLAAPPGETP